MTEIAAFLGLHRDTVSEVLNRQAVPRRQRGISPDLVGEVIASYDQSIPERWLWHCEGLAYLSALVEDGPNNRR